MPRSPSAKAIASSSALVCSDWVWPRAGTHRLDSRAGYVVERILLGERPARGLAMRTQGQRFRVLGVEFFDDFRPEHTCRTHLAISMKWFIPIAQKNDRRGAKASTDIPAARPHAGTPDRRPACRPTRCRPWRLLLHMVAGDRNRVELRHVLRGVFEDVGDDLHREFRRINIGIAHHELLEDVVLDRTRQLIEVHPCSRPVTM